MKTISRISKIIFRTLFIISLLFWVGVFCIWVKPSLLLNTENLGRFAKYLQKYDIHVSWRTAALSADSESFLKKKIFLSAVDFCVEAKTYRLNSCFDKVDLPVEVSFDQWPYRIKIGDMEFSGGDLQLEHLLNSSPDKKPASSGSLLPALPSFLKHIKFNRIHVGMRRLRLTLDDTKVEMQFDLKAFSEDKKSSWQLSQTGTISQPDSHYQTSVNLNVESMQDQWFGPYSADGKVGLKLSPSEELSLEGNLDSESVSELAYQVSARYKNKKQIYVGDFRGTLDNNSTKGSVTFPELTPTRKLPMTLQTCSYELRPKSASSELQLQCPLLWKGDIGSGRIGAKLEGALSSFPSGWKFDAETEIAFPQFAKLTALLHNTEFAVPQPFAVLDGEIKVKASGSGTLSPLVGNFPVHVETHLSSASQSVNVNGTGEVSISEHRSGFRTHLAMDLELADVKLKLPALTLQHNPQFLPDGRFKSTEQLKAEKKREEESFTYDIRLYTSDGKPIRLISNLTQNEIPILMSIRTASEKDPEGYLKILGFSGELFRRKATVKHLDLKFNQNPSLTEVNGEIEVKYVDYTIHILLLGPLNEPQIKFSSDPPLKEDQVVATLLFGQPMEALNSDQAQSVGNTQAAVANSAISLASMYVLASTPVQSVGYDPISGTFSAKVRLSDGTSLNVGSNMQQLSQLGIRHRLGRDFAITTYLLNPLDPLQRTLTAFLEWNKRY